MAALAASGAEEGLWLRATRQTGGRVRSGRIWSSGEGNLHISTLVRLQPGDPPPHTLALVAAVAAHAAVDALVPGSGVTIKWPNDLMVGDPSGGWAKLCGMLLERVGDAVVVGFGLNVTHAPQIEGRRTIDLASLGAGADMDAARVGEALAESFGTWLALWRREGLAPVRQAWQVAAHPTGTALRVLLPDGSETEGSFAGLAEDGALILLRRDGGAAVIHAGDVFAI